MTLTNYIEKMKFLCEKKVLYMKDVDFELMCELVEYDLFGGHHPLLHSNIKAKIFDFMFSLDELVEKTTDTNMRVFLSFIFICSIEIRSIICGYNPGLQYQRNNNNGNPNTTPTIQFNPYFSYLPPSFNYTNSLPSPVLAPTNQLPIVQSQSQIQPQYVQQPFLQPQQSIAPNPYYTQPPFIPNPIFNPSIQQAGSPYGYTTVPRMIYVDPSIGYNFNKAPMYMRKQSIQDLCSAYAPEEKTVIYVLSQKPEFGIENIEIPKPTKPSKPEVFFIRYKTPEEADYAQKHIQAQYDALGGTSEISNEGVVPVSSYEGALANNKTQKYI